MDTIAVGQLGRMMVFLTIMIRITGIRLIIVMMTNIEIGNTMKYGDVEGKGKIYGKTGELVLARGERLERSVSGTLLRGWVRYKLGWRTIMFKGQGCFNITNKRVVYLEVPQYVGKIHTFNLDHELGDFGGWDYHAHSIRRAAMQNALLFFELPLNEITEIKHKSKEATIFAKDEKNKYKIIVEPAIAQDIESFLKKNKPKS